MEMTESVVKALSGPVLLLDDKFRAVMANPAFYRILQITPGELEGKSIREFMSNKNGARQLIKVLEPVTAADGEVEDVNVTCTLPDGAQVLLSVSARFVPEAPGRRKLLIVELRDITERTNAERKIQELNQALVKHVARVELTNKELESFSHSISHDLRTPLRLIDKVIHGLLHDYGTQLPADAIGIINMISSATQEMESLIHVLLKFSWAMQSPVNRRKVDMQRLTQEVIAEIRNDQDESVIEFVVEKLPPCYVNRALFKEVLRNLVSNSIKFTWIREQARIHIGSIVAEGETVYFVRDNGVGFDMGKASFLFTAFHRLHKQSEYSGSGIGLALVRRIIERHGGRIWCESEINKGATFYFAVGAEATPCKQHKGSHS